MPAYSAIVASKKYAFKNEVILKTQGGILKVQFNEDYSLIYLCGKVEKIFEGLVEFH
jgi:diaminopimelate epimerase